jgi:hypothetical protein
VVIGVLFVGIFLAIVATYVWTEYLLGWLDARRRVMVGRGYPFFVIIGANITSFALVWLSAMVLVLVSGGAFYFGATIVCLCAQAVWLGQHLWVYYRDRLRLRYEN